MDPRLKRILPRVQKPARYTGGEYREIQKDKSKVDLRFAFCFPDNYQKLDNYFEYLNYHRKN